MIYAILFIVSGFTISAGFANLLACNPSPYCGSITASRQDNADANIPYQKHHPTFYTLYVITNASSEVIVFCIRSRYYMGCKFTGNRGSVCDSSSCWSPGKHILQLGLMTDTRTRLAKMWLRKQKMPFHCLEPEFTRSRIDCGAWRMFNKTKPRRTPGASPLFLPFSQPTKPQ